MPGWIKLLVALVVVAALVLLAGSLRLLPGLPDPFGSETKDRSGPALLKSIQDMSRYEAASGNFQIVVDLDKDAKFLPDPLLGRRTLYVGAGSVPAYVDLGGVKGDAVTVSDDRRTATVRLPRADLGKPSLDQKRSYVVAQERGLFDRFGDFFTDNPVDQQNVQQVAVEKIGKAADDSDLRGRAESNTKQMMENLLKSLGFTKATVTFPEKD